MNERDQAFLARHRALKAKERPAQGPRESAEAVEIAGEIIRGSMREKSFRFFDGKRTECLPRSQCTINDNDTVTMPLWLAKEKGFI